MVDLNFLDFNFWNSGHMLHTWYSFSIITTAYSRQQLVKATTCFKHPDWLFALVMLFEDSTGLFNGAGWSKCSSVQKWVSDIKLLNGSVYVYPYMWQYWYIITSSYIFGRQIRVRGCWLQDLKSLFVVRLVSQEVLHLRQDGQRQLWKNLWNQREEQKNTFLLHWETGFSQWASLDCFYSARVLIVW